MNYDVNVNEFPNDNLEWEEIALGEFDEYRKQRNIPVLDIDVEEAFNNLALGNYR